MKRFCILLLFLAGSAFASFAQQQARGKVTDDQGNPLGGVSITVKGSKSGTMTNNDGTFVLNSSGKTVLTISHSGYKTIEIVSDGTSPLSIKMETKENRLDDVIVVGYGTRRQKDVTGSVGAINNKD